MSEVRELPVDVDVDAEGGWSVDGVPMVLVPRHLITNTLAAAEAGLGVAGAAVAVRESGRRSARWWCADQARRLGLDDVTVVDHYLDQLSRRGWGRFGVEVLDARAGRLVLTVEGSAPAARAERVERPACWIFEGWLEGALEHARASLGLAGPVAVTETHCRATGAPHCRFEGGTVESTGGA